MFTGEFKNDLLFKGILKTDSYLYEGTFLNNMMHGDGNIRYTNKDFYIGIILKNRLVLLKYEKRKR